MIFKDKIAAYLSQHFRLDWQGVHGAPHWARVRLYGSYLAKGSTADLEVITLFALLHDSCRLYEHSDHGHGDRAASLVQYMSGHLFELEAEQEHLLSLAIARHSGGHMSDDATVQICWDADRLDLGRLGIVTMPDRLGSARARHLCQYPWPYDSALGVGDLLSDDRLE